MRTQMFKYLSRLSEQIEHNQTHMALIRKEVYPDEYGKPIRYKDRLARVVGTGAYIHRQSKLSALKSMQERTNKLVDRYTQMLLKYPDYDNELNQAS